MSEDWKVNRKCDGCGKLFIVKRKAQRFCSPACRAKFHVDNPKEHACTTCGQPCKGYSPASDPFRWFLPG